MDITDPALQPFFSVTVDGHRLGMFTACDGLGVEVVIESREEGGNNEYVHHLPVRMKYTNIKLTRPLNGDSAAVASWFASMSGTVTRATGHITALRPDGQTIMTWHLNGVIPVRWQGPSFGVANVQVATETLELAHHGFRFEQGR